MGFSQWARRLGDFLGVELDDEDEIAVARERASHNDEPTVENDGATDAAAATPPEKPRRLPAVHGPASEQELTDLRNALEELRDKMHRESDR